jgi:RHS repeat-associated protein
MEKLVISILLVFALQPTWGQDSQNYVKMTRHTTNDGSLDTYQYYDELGRLYEEVEVEITPRHSNLFKLIEYDGIGRKQSVWLPAVDNSMVLPKQQYPNQAVSTNVDGKPFSRTYYDGSPLNREVGIEESGVAWIGHRQSKDYLHNSLVFPLNCQDYYVTVSGELACRGNYAADRLLVEKETDEDAHVTYVFRDVQDRIILQRSILGDNTSADTYYVYDYRGDLRFVLQPEFQNTSDQDLYTFQYTYDSHHQVIEKKLPGAEPVVYAYDKAHQLIFSQDGNQRLKGEWTFVLNDCFGRLAVKGTCQEPLPDISEQSLFVSYDGSGSCGYAIPSTFVNVSLQTVCYYDDYSFRQLETTSLSNMLMPMSLPDYDDFTDMTRGLLTGQRDYLMPSATPSYIVKAYYYDDRCRIVQTHSTNHLGGADAEFLDLSFTGKPLKRKRMTAAGLSYQPLSVTEEYVYTYDHADRLITTTHSLNGATPVVLVSNEYDDIGRLKSNKPRNSNALKTQYTYNVRSWPKTISSPLFSETLYYEDGTTPCWNGNISSMTWNADSILRRYNFQYDGLSRLTQADYQEQAGLNARRFATNYTYDRHGNLTSINRSGWTMSLPIAMSPSLLSVQALPESSSLLQEVYGTVDSLTATYNGNQLLAVSNAVTTPPMSTNGHANFVDGASASVEYAYDANGNLIQDLNKGLSAITYNAQNLPDSAVFSSGCKINYVYSADGVKRQVTYTTPASSIVTPIHFSAADITAGVQGGLFPGGGGIISPVVPITDIVKTFDYCGNAIYEDKVLTTLLFDGGYVSYTKTGIGIHATYTPTYHFYMKDHLGSNRVVASATGEAEQVNHYYPYGSTFYGEKPSNQRFKYCGKELDKMHGLNWYDSNARYYDHVLGRFHQIDPLAEKYYAWSPYAYCHNNPVILVDPDGRDDYYTSSGMYIGTNSAKTDYIYISDDYRKLKDGRYAINVYTRVALPVSDISAEALSKIFTHVIGRMPEVDLNKLDGKQINVVKWSTEAYGNGIKVVDQHGNCQDGYDNTNASTKGNNITVFYGDNSKMFETRSNIQNMLGVEEYTCHFKNQWHHFLKDSSMPNKKDNEKIFKYLENHPTWNKTTKYFKTALTDYKNSFK